jgi:hypothetical protein
MSIAIDELEEALNQLQYRRKKKVELKAVRRTGFSECWMMISHTAKKEGYQRLTLGKDRMYAHRAVAVIVYGDIPEHMTVSHLCETKNSIESRQCMNPDHLIIETQRDNLNRSPNRKHGRSACTEHSYCKYRTKKLNLH